MRYTHFSKVSYDICIYVCIHTYEFHRYCMAYTYNTDMIYLYVVYQTGLAQPKGIPEFGWGASQESDGD